MVESEAQELSEEVMLGAVTFGHAAFQPVINAIIELAEHAAKEPWPLPEKTEEAKGARRPRRCARPRRHRRSLPGEGQAGPPRQGRRRQEGGRRRAARPKGLDPEKAKGILHDLEADVVRDAILETGIRIDGRDTRTVRPIIAEVGILPRAHGSALFTRGETQAFCVATLGTGQDEQIVDALEGEYREHFMLHYNFPPYSVGEAGRMGSPGPPRNRPRQAGLARRASAAAGEGQVPLHPARGVGDHRIQRLVLDGDRLRHLAGADGCRRAAEAAGGGHRHGPDQGGQGLRRAVRHPRRRGPPRRHGLQGRRHRAGRHQPADGHQDHLHHAATS